MLAPPPSASWFCDISPVVKDVPEEPEPKEPKDSLIQNTEPNGNQQAAEEVSEQETPELDSGHITEGEEEAAAELAKEGGERQEGMSTQQVEYHTCFKDAHLYIWL